MAGLLGKGANKSVYSKNRINGIPRTKIDRHFSWRTTFNSGRLIPLFMDEFLPAETKGVNLGALVRSITPLGPTMDNSFLDIFFFFVPRRLVWDHWEEFIAGYNKEAWAQDIVYEIPKIKFKKPTIKPTTDGGTFSKDTYLHSFFDYLPGAVDVVSLAQGFISHYDSETHTYPTAQDDFDEWFGPAFIDACYPRAYVKVWNDWFRDENYQDELELYTGDNDEYAQDFAFNLLDPTSLPKAAKYHNRFTTALPSPVKGPDVLIPAQQFAWLESKGENLHKFGTDGVLFGNTSGEAPAAASYLFADDDGSVGFSESEIDGQGSFGSSNLGINLQAAMGTIRQLRLATQTELLLSRDARGGTRYVESLLAHFGVHNGDARLQRAEYLGSRQIPLTIMEVTNTSQADGEALGNVGGKSVTKDNAHYFTYSATEHGILVCVGVVRTNLSYSTGVRKIYQRFTRFDHIWPEFRHIGDVPLMARELSTVPIFQDEGNYGEEVFGYTPYGSEIREGYNFNNGLFRPDATGSLAYLTYQEDLGLNPPEASADYIEQSDEPIKNTLIDQNGPQFYALFVMKMTDTIPLDPTSDPGLMDHF